MGWVSSHWIHRLRLAGPLGGSGTRATYFDSSVPTGKASAPGPSMLDLGAGASSLSGAGTVRRGGGAMLALVVPTTKRSAQMLGRADGLELRQLMEGVIRLAGQALVGHGLIGGRMLRWRRVLRLLARWWWRQHGILAVVGIEGVVGRTALSPVARHGRGTGAIYGCNERRVVSVDVIRAQGTIPQRHGSHRLCPPLSQPLEIGALYLRRRSESPRTNGKGAGRSSHGCNHLETTATQ
jgi:hypothetical protein